MRRLGSVLLRGCTLVALFLFAANASAQEASEPPPKADTHWAEASLEGLVGARRLSVGTFDAPLRASGYGALPRTFVGGGFAIDLSLARWRFEIPMLYSVASAPSLVDANGVGAAVGDVSIDFGYDVLRYHDFTAFVLGGLGVSALMIDTRDPHWSWVASRTRVGSDVSRVEDDAFVLGMQVGAQQVIPLGNTRERSAWALYLSLRAGYKQEIADLGWVTSDSSSKSVGGLPAVDVGGAWTALSIGLGAFGSPPIIARH